MNGTRTGRATTSVASSTPTPTAVPVFNNSGGQVGVAVTNPATGAVELVSPGGKVLGVIQHQNGAVNLISAGGTIIGSFALNQATGQVALGVPATSTPDNSGTSTANSTTTSTPSPSTSPTEQTPAAAVRVFDSMGTQVGIAVTNPATGIAELIGAGGKVLGVIQQQNGAVNLMSAGGTVIGSFALNQATGQVVITTSPSTASMAAVPVFAISSIQIGVAMTNPATGSVELLGANGTTLGVVVAQQSGAVALIGAGGTVLGSFAANQATGQVLFSPAVGAVASTGAGTVTASGGVTGSADAPGSAAAAPKMAAAF